MKSIRVKLYVGILLILSVFLCGIFSYGLFFKGYFQKEKLHEMEEVIVEVEDIAKNYDLEYLDEKINEIAEWYNVQIEILSTSSGKSVCGTHNINRGIGMGGMNKFEVIKEIGKKNKVNKSIIYDKSSGVEFLTASKEIIELKYKINVKTPINIMDDAVNKSITFLLKIFIPIIMFVLVLTFVFSNGFTKPILAIRKKTLEITKLNFTEDIKINGMDEIADLAFSVNTLSNSIKGTLKELEEKNKVLEKMIERERENEEVRREFVSSVSHELKSPIAVISGYAQVLEEDIIENKEDRKYYINVINEEASRMQVIVNDLLDLYKLQSNTFKLNMMEIKLGDLARRIIKKNSIRFIEENIKIESNIENPLVYGDEIRLEQAIQNYINNAISHVDENRKIVIKVDEKAKVSVFNSGEKIEENNLEKIWQGFVRADKVRNYKEKRVGLGLTIVNQIVKLHNGSCGVSNKKDGVEFWIKLNVNESINIL